MCNSSLFVSHSFPKRWTKGRCWAAHLCLFNPRQGDVLCVELRVTQRFLSIIHRAAAASVLLFNSPADHIIPSPQPKAICETRALQGNSIKAPTNISAFCFQSYSWWKKDAFAWRITSQGIWLHFINAYSKNKWRSRWNVLIKMPVFRHVIGRAIELLLAQSSRSFSKPFCWQLE